MSNMLPKLCVPIMATNLDELIDHIKKIQTDLELVEIRADYLDKINKEDIDKIFKTLSTPAIFTLRKIKDGGKFSEEVEVWKDLIEHALTLGFEYIDLEFPSARYVDQTNKHPQTKIITSVHYFHHTPGYRDLRKVQKRMRGIKPNLMKFATFVQTDNDLINLTRLLTSSKKADQMIVIGMGPKGKLTRFIHPLLGSKINFVTLEESESSAPGQISASDFETFIDTLKNLQVNLTGKFINPVYNSRDKESQAATKT